MQKMRQQIIVILLSVLCVTSIFGGPELSKENAVPYTVKLGTGNDMFTFASGINQDDQLSFSFEGEVSAPLWKTTFGVDAITNKGWYFDGVRHTGRYDKIYGIGSMTAGVADTGSFELILTPSVGISFFGNAGIQNVQNGWHKLLGLKGYNLTYEGSNIYSPHIALSADAIYKTEIADDSVLKAGVRLSSINDILFQYEQSLFLNFKIGKKHKDIFDVLLGYSFYQQHGENYTQKVYLNYIKGFNLRTQFNLGIFSIKYSRVFSSTSAYATFFIDFFEFSSFNGQYKNSDLYYSFGYNFKGYNFNNHTRWNSKLSYKIPNTDFRVYIENAWTSGRSFVSSERDHAFTLFGVQYDVPSGWSKGWFAPFVGLGLGYARWTMYEYKNGVVPNGENNIDYKSIYTFVMAPNVGFSLFPDDLISTSTFSYKLVFTLSTRLIFNNRKADNMFWDQYKAYRSDSGYTHINFIDPCFTIAIEVGCDL